MKEEMDNQPGGATVTIPPPPGLAMPVPMDLDNAIPHPEDAVPQPDLPIPGRSDWRTTRQRRKTTNGVNHE
eukprot:1020638-Amphidinium_carterae.1